MYLQQKYHKIVCPNSWLITLKIPRNTIRRGWEVLEEGSNFERYKEQEEREEQKEKVEENERLKREKRGMRGEWK